MKTPIDVLMDCQYVKRWTMVGVSMESTVASHSFGVAMIAMEIRKRMFNTASITEKDVCYYALIHDVKESYTGDIPTPTKTGMKAAGFDPDNYHDDHIGEEPPSGVLIQSIIKAADLIENYVFIKEHATGTRGRCAIVEVDGRLRAYLAGASQDLREAAVRTMYYIIGRGSDAVEERERLKEARETGHRVGAGFKPSPVMGREPRNSAGNP